MSDNVKSIHVPGLKQYKILPDDMIDKKVLSHALLNLAEKKLPKEPIPVDIDDLIIEGKDNVVKLVHACSNPDGTTLAEMLEKASVLIGGSGKKYLAMLSHLLKISRFVHDFKKEDVEWLDYTDPVNIQEMLTEDKVSA